MDCLFNLQIPKPTSTTLILRPLNKTWVNGLSSLYDPTYPKELVGVMNEEEFNFILNDINDTLFIDWPCCFCFCFDYSLCLCPLGLSLCIPHWCINSARIKAERDISKINTDLSGRGISLKLVRKCSTSWIEIHFVPPRI